MLSCAHTSKHTRRTRTDTTHTRQMLLDRITHSSAHAPAVPWGDSEVAARIDGKLNEVCHVNWVETVPGYVCVRSFARIRSKSSRTTATLCRATGAMCLLAAVRSTFVQHLMVMRLIPRVPSLFRQLNALIDWGTRLFFCPDPSAACRTYLTNFP